jgi:hypothetical protein
MRFEHSLGIRLGPAGMGPGHGGKKPVPETGQRADFSDEAFTIRPTDGEFQSREFTVPNTLRQHQLGLIGPELPELAPFLIDPRGAVREHLLQHLGHPLRGASVDAELLLDLGQRHALIAGGSQFGEAQEVGGFLEGHRASEAGDRAHDRFCHPYAASWGC